MNPQKNTFSVCVFTLLSLSTHSQLTKSVFLTLKKFCSILSKKNTLIPSLLSKVVTFDPVVSPLLSLMGLIFQKYLFSTSLVCTYTNTLLV